jgi:hypothetical protein
MIDVGNNGNIPQIFPFHKLFMELRFSPSDILSIVPVERPPAHPIAFIRQWSGRGGEGRVWGTEFGRWQYFSYGKAFDFGEPATAVS